MIQKQINKQKSIVNDLDCGQSRARPRRWATYWLCSHRCVCVGGTGGCVPRPGAAAEAAPVYLCGLQWLCADDGLCCERVGQAASCRGTCWCCPLPGSALPLLGTDAHFSIFPTGSPCGWWGLIPTKPPPGRGKGSGLATPSVRICWPRQLAQRRTCDPGLASPCSSQTSQWLLQGSTGSQVGPKNLNLQAFVIPTPFARGPLGD